jgi:hypothetical protein
MKIILSKKNIFNLLKICNNKNLKKLKTRKDILIRKYT